MYKLNSNQGIIVAAHTHNLFPFSLSSLEETGKYSIFKQKKDSLGSCLRKMVYFSQSKGINLLCFDLYHMVYKQDRGKYSSYFLFYLLSYPTSNAIFFFHYLR